jgi:hypothetical protein
VKEQAMHGTGLRASFFAWALAAPIAASACSGSDDTGDGAGTTGTDATMGAPSTSATPDGSSTAEATSTISAGSGDATSGTPTDGGDPSSGGDDNDPDSTGDGDGPGSSDGAGGGPPEIVQIAWEHAQPCQSPQMREVTVTVTVDDPDTAEGELSFSGGIAGCDGEIDAAVSTLVCEGSSNHVGAVTVTDARGGSDDGAFTVIVCQDGTRDP